VPRGRKSRLRMEFYDRGRCAYRVTVTTITHVIRRIAYTPRLAVNQCDGHLRARGAICVNPRFTSLSPAQHRCPNYPRLRARFLRENVFSAPDSAGGYAEEHNFCPRMFTASQIKPPAGNLVISLSLSFSLALPTPDYSRHRARNMIRTSPVPRDLKIDFSLNPRFSSLRVHVARACIGRNGPPREEREREREKRNHERMNNSRGALNQVAPDFVNSHRRMSN